MTWLLLSTFLIWLLDTNILEPFLEIISQWGRFWKKETHALPNKEFKNLTDSLVNLFLLISSVV